MNPGVSTLREKRVTVASPPQSRPSATTSSSIRTSTSSPPTACSTRRAAEGVFDIPPPPAPPFDIDTFESIEPPWQAIREWIPDDDAEPGFDLFDQRPDSGKPVEIPREDGSILVLDGG